MNSKSHRQIEFVLRDAVKDCTVTLNERLKAMYVDHSAKGRLHSGATVRAAIRTMEEIALEAVPHLSSKTLEIARDQDAFAAFNVAMSDLIEFFRDELPTIVRMASGRMPCEPNSSVETAAGALFDEMESKIDRKIEIAEFSFEDSSASPVESPLGIRTPKTGRPRSAFWDDMWASVAYDLYEGNLKPRTQADLEEAMLRWIEGHGYSAATSTVRARARRLWDLISAR